MDRVTDYESAGRKFESCWAHHLYISENNSYRNTVVTFYPDEGFIMYGFYYMLIPHTLDCDVIYIKIVN
jgi:hypothetical protein